MAQLLISSVFYCFSSFMMLAGFVRSFKPSTPIGISLRSSCIAFALTLRIILKLHPLNWLLREKFEFHFKQNVKLQLVIQRKENVSYAMKAVNILISICKGKKGGWGYIQTLSPGQTIGRELRKKYGYVYKGAQVKNGIVTFRILSELDFDALAWICVRVWYDRFYIRIRVRVDFLLIVDFILVSDYTKFWIRAFVGFLLEIAHMLNRSIFSLFASISF